MTIKDISGQRFGRLSTLTVAVTRGRLARWECACDCGNRIIVSGAALRKGNTKSCGCLKREMAGSNLRTHGLSHTREFRIWSLMLDRCRNPRNQDFSYYGGRGIVVCERWNDFKNFYDDMGVSPAKLTLDRINNDGHYEPSNCRWATRKEQRANQRRPVAS